MEYILYKDDTRTDLWMSIIMLIPALILLTAAAYIALTEPSEFPYIATITLMIILFLFFIIPTNYSIYNNHIRICFKGHLHLKIPFSTIKSCRPQKWYSIGINLPSRISVSDGVDIIRKSRMTISITPTGRDEFLRQFNNAFKLWKTSEGGYFEAG